MYVNSRDHVNFLSAPTSIRFEKDITKVFKYEDIAEIPSGSARYYKMTAHKRAHEGFPNEYWLALGTPCNNLGVLINVDLP
jgi:hypothetical protein